ncbi:INO80 complex subunit B-like [Oppia nitens]|uniref:INO80 complex subunit B-like n=1 Tax=Oppia nitens TaxID=1686743 RepID=UPI0023DC6BCA|nr:INO80 complex subunit B-like [Oppia nitens]
MTDRLVTTTTTSQSPLKVTIKVGGDILSIDKCIKKSSSTTTKTTIVTDNTEATSTSASDVTVSEEQLDLSMSGVFDDEEEEDDDDNDEEIVDNDDDYEQEEMDDNLDNDNDDHQVLADKDDDQWLDELEEGRAYHEVDDELRKIRDPKLMTARQRALLENKSLKGKTDSMTKGIYSSSASTSASVHESVAAAVEKNMAGDELLTERKLLKDRRRRQLAEEKREKDRKQTIERLLRKRHELAQKAKKRKIVVVETPRITYKNCQTGIYICLPEGLSFDQLWPRPSAGRPVAKSGGNKAAVVECCRNGCQNAKKYTMSKTGRPVCSLDCYKMVENNVISLDHQLIS